MEYFIIEGMIQNPELMDNSKLQEHIQYTQKAMNQGLILISGLKGDNSGGIFVMKIYSRKELEDYLTNEPFYIHGIQTYNVTEFTPHYFNESPHLWFHNDKV